MNITQQLWSAKEWARVKATGSEVVIMVHNATNEDKWGPTGQQMDEICRAFPRGGQQIMEELRWRMKNRDKSWRACYKSLLVLDYLARNCGDPYLPEICSVVPTLRTIAQSFFYTNPKGVDHGVSVRERAKNLADLMSDGLLLREERQKATQTKAKLARGASDGGGPNSGQGRCGGYGNYSGGDSDRYGGRSGGSGYSNANLNSRPTYTGGARGGYDPYRPTSPPTTTNAPPRTKEEQERYDLEMALRMQRDEERRAGVSAEELEVMYARQARKTNAREQRTAAAAEADEDLARRLQEEEDARARREGRELPTLRSDTVATTLPTANAPPASGAPTPAKAGREESPKQQPASNVLDDLFAPAPTPAVTSVPQAPPQVADPWAQQQQQKQQQWNQFSQQPTAPAASGQWSQFATPSAPPQQQTNPWDQPQQQQQTNTWGQPQQQQSTDSWAHPQANTWSQPTSAPQPQQASANPWDQPAALQQQQQQPPASSNGMWGNSYQQPPQQQQTAGASMMWGQPVTAPQGGFSMPQQQQQQPGAQVTAATNNMWGTLDQFSNQQQRKQW